MKYLKIFTGGMRPRIRFEFSDGQEFTTGENGYGVENEEEKYQVLIAKWFNK